MKMTSLILKDNIKKELGIVHDVMKLYGLCNDVIINEEQYSTIVEQIEKQKDHNGKKMKLKDYFDIKTKNVEVKTETIKDEAEFVQLLENVTNKI